ncbi:MAG: HAD-IC family P-type ATPase [Candidatus Magasanikbacteria bacterium]|nr:HAD-IC family P-type ATPase [Candidatus Magasanikbacteria bacterium]
MHHAQNIAHVLKKLNSSREGLSNNEAKKRIAKYGKNKFSTAGERISRFKIFLNQWKSPLIIILVVAGTISGFLGDYPDMIIIFITTLVNAVIGFVQEDKANRALQKLGSMIKYKAVVLRGGNVVSLNSESVTVGDILILNAGDKIQADGRIIQEKDLKVNEALLTGEVEPVKKTIEKIEKDTRLPDRRNMVHKGTIVASGVARVVVTSIGVNTEIGKVAQLVKETEDVGTPLQEQLRKLAKTLGILIVLVSFAVILLGIFSPFAEYEIVELFEVSVAMAVAAIPEGLVISLTVILAIGMQKILKKKALVRRLVSAETLGSVSVICTDKTGTLTEGKMFVTQISTVNNDFDVENEYNLKKNKEAYFILLAGIFANDAYLQKSVGKKVSVIGDTTDAAFLHFGHKIGLDKVKLEKRNHRLDELPFESRTKYIAVLQSEKSKTSMYIKGAPEVILKKAEFYRKGEKVFKMTAEKRKFFEKKHKELASRGLRVLSVGYKTFSKDKDELSFKDTKNLILLGLVGISDPIRADVIETFKITQEAGIRVIMITGDHIETARAIGEKIGLNISKESVLSGDDLQKIDDKTLRKVIEKVNIFARVEPGDKMRIVKALQLNGEIVAMTGDGVNDTPALKGADIGVSLGSGTDVAKEVSDLILLDDNFSTIVYSVEEGRTIYQNVKKVVLYLLSGSFAEITLISVSLVVGLPLPILPAQILWINIIEDSFPNMALAFDKGEKENMKEPPRRKNEKLIDGEMKAMIGIISIVANVMLLGIFLYFWKTTGDIQLTRTIVFLGLAVDSLLYIFSVRSMRHHVWERNPFGNMYLNLAVLFGWLMLIAAVYLKPLQILLKTVPIGLKEWTILIIFGLVNVFLIEFIKTIYLIRRRKKYDR